MMTILVLSYILKNQVNIIYFIKFIVMKLTIVTPLLALYVIFSISQS